MPVYPIVRSIPAQWNSPRVRSGVVKYDGAVLRVETTCERVMSDVWEDLTYAIVWDAAAGCTARMFMRGGYSESESEAVVDATPEVIAAYDAYMVEKARQASIIRTAILEDEAEARVREVRRGCRAVVAKGRKVAKGTEGRVFWLGESAYGWRAGLETDSGETVWTALSNLTRVLPPKPEGMGWRDFENSLHDLAAAAAA